MKKLLLFLIITILTPYLVIYFFIREIDVQEFQFSSNTMVRVLRSSTNIIETVPLEEYIMGVVAGEMPVSFELEALKAQAVASRSYVMYHIQKNANQNYDVIDTTKNQVYIGSDELKTKWGAKYEENVQKIRTAIYETSYEYITYNDKIAEALFFSTSTGQTENSEEIFVSKVAYLRSVPSPWDNISPVSSTNTKYTIKQVISRLKLKDSSKLNIEIIETTSTGRIKKIKINEKTFTGGEVASALSLRSSFFTITVNDNNVSISTRGFGHGVGMSQYGAEGMARNGYKYDDILKHYYTGIEIKKIKN